MPMPAHPPFLSMRRGLDLGEGRQSELQVSFFEGPLTQGSKRGYQSKGTPDCMGSTTSTIRLSGLLYPKYGFRVLQHGLRLQHT